MVETMVTLKLKQIDGVWVLCMIAGKTELGIPLTFVCDFLEDARPLIDSIASSLRPHKKKKERRESYVV
jgi:hypothetical protein